MCIGNLVFERYVKAIKGHFEFPAGALISHHISRSAPPTTLVREGWRARSSEAPPTLASDLTLALVACQSNVNKLNSRSSMKYLFFAAFLNFYDQTGNRIKK